MMWMIDAVIACCAVAFVLNMVIFVREIRAYRAAKRRRCREKTVHVRAEDLAVVIAEFVNE